ncbi:DUF1801 domain-containing protein [Tellurirhabdus rosea]|uniref:DUF1801 domain-containing protein n=1 Tax=Tellurirhabdus rosea TaxID=2674997 RepID=UPI00224FBC88|nr:DUF1801 domain-containing protein [Tellurirhabdus rosea]
MNTLDTFLAQLDPEVRDLTLHVRQLIRTVLPDAHEELRPTYRTIAYGRSPRMTDEICYISLLSTGINLGFHYGTQLPDPHGLLKGTGKLMRTIRLESTQDAQNPSIRQLLEAARTHASF